MLRRVLLGVVVLLVAAQFVPYGRNHTNPTATGGPLWPDQHTRSLAKRACFDCHSNQTAWPWYTRIAPISWLSQWDVARGRGAFDFSEWDKRPHDSTSAALARAVRNGSMPPWFYLPLHPSAELTASEKATLAAGLAKLR